MKNSDGDASDTAKLKQKRTHKTPMIQINLRIDQHFLWRIDEAAKEDCTTRSKLIRTAVYWYLSRITEIWSKVKQIIFLRPSNTEELLPQAISGSRITVTKLMFTIRD